MWKSNSAKKNYVISSITFHPTDQVLVIATNNCLLFWNWSRPEPFAMCKTDHDYEKVRCVVELIDIRALIKGDVGVLVNIQ